MKLEEELLEALAATNPVAGPEQVDPHELLAVLSAIDERRGRMTTRTPISKKHEPRDTETRASDDRRTTWKPAVAFVSALVLVLATIGAAALIMRDADGTAPDIGTPEVVTTVPTNAPEVVTPSSEAPTPEPPPRDPPIVPSISAVSDQPEYFSSLAVTADGLPVISSYTQQEGEVGTARLFLCGDPACESFETIELMELAWPGGTAGVAISPRGSIYVSFGQTAWRYREGNVDVMPNLILGPELPGAFDLAGNPLLLGYGSTGAEPEPWTSPADIVLVACEDALCTSSTETVLATTDGFVEIHGPFVGPGGTVSAVYPIAQPLSPPDPEAGFDGAEFDVATFVATCADPSCASGVTRTEIARGPWPRAAALDPDGNLEVWSFRWQEGSEGADTEFGFDAAGCIDVTCSERITRVGPTHHYPSQYGNSNTPLNVFEVAPDGTPISLYVEAVYDPEEWAAYAEREQRILEAGLDQDPMEPDPLGMNLNVATCVDAVCSTYRVATIATPDSSSYLHGLDLEFGADGMMYVLATGNAETGEPNTQHIGERGLQLYGFPKGDIPEVAPLEGVRLIVGYLR